MNKKIVLYIGIAIGTLLIGLGVYFATRPDASIIVNTSNTPSNTTQTVSNTPNNPVNFKTEVVLTGKEDGVKLGTLLPNESGTISYISGKIISNTKNGFTAPIWGVPINQTDESWIPLMPYAKEGMWTNAIFVDTGEKRIPFKEGQYEIKVKNTTSQTQTLFLRFHEARGYNFDNEGDARFEFKKGN